MSGGSWDYLTFKVEEAADRLENEKSPLRRAFGKHVRLVAEALYDIEWVDSGDKVSGSEREAIKAVFYDDAEGRELSELLEDGRAIVEQLRRFGVENRGPGEGGKE